MDRHESLSYEDVSAQYPASELYRLVLVQRGSCLLKTAAGNYSVNAPAALCFNDSDSCTLDSCVDWKQLELFFHPATVNSAFTAAALRDSRANLSFTQQQDYDYLSAFVLRDGHSTGVLALSPAEAGRIGRLMLDYDAEIAQKRDRYWPCRSRACLLEILFLIFKMYHTLSNESLLQNLDDSLAGRIVHHLNCSAHERIRLDELCRRFDTNRTTLTRLVRSATGYPVIDYVNRLRAGKAALLLRDTSLPVDEVAARSGFNDSSHFSRLFKRIMNVSPGAYRRSFRDDVLR